MTCYVVVLDRALQAMIIRDSKTRGEAEIFASARSLVEQIVQHHAGNHMHALAGACHLFNVL